MGELAGIDYHLSGVNICVHLIGSIVAFVMRQMDGANHVEGRRKQAVGLTDEVVARRAGCSVVCEAFFIELPRETNAVRFGLKLDVVELYEQEKPTHVALGGEIGNSSCTFITGALIGSLGTLAKDGFARLHHPLLAHLDIGFRELVPLPSIVAVEIASVRADKPVPMFVTH